MAQHTAASCTTFNPNAILSTVHEELRLQSPGSLHERNTGSKLGSMSFFIKATVSAPQGFTGDQWPPRRRRPHPIINNYEHWRSRGDRKGTRRARDPGSGQKVLRRYRTRPFAGYATKARDGGKSRSEDLAGRCFVTISNGGIYRLAFEHADLESAAVRDFSGCTNPGAPRGGVRARVVVPSGYVSGAQLRSSRRRWGRSRDILVRVKDGIENPSRLLLDL